MKGKKFDIASNLQQLNGRFEVYNTTAGLLHFIRLGKRGQRLAMNHRNLQTISREAFDYGVAAGKVTEVQANG